LSAHQSIGVPQPLIMFGTDEQKNKYLPRFAKGAISAFALTEPEVGSDPARMSTTATPIENGDAYLINGQKLWCTNGPVADILIVMAQTPVQDGDKIKKKITAFIVEKEMPGFKTLHRCQFMGLHGIQNGLIEFKNVRVPKENILWGLGKGLKLALITLNTGRLTIPAASSGAAKWCLNVSRHWANSRNQWGAPVGQHDAVAAKIADMAAHTFAMESITWLTSAMADQKKTDIRLEAAMAKLFCSEASWRITDDTVQIRGGRGYETAQSLKARGEEGIPVERAMRDMRINLIIEGTSEIMHLFIAREAMDLHLQFIFPLLNPRVKIGTKIKTVFKAIGFYCVWYPKLWFSRRTAKTPVAVPKEIQPHLNFIQKQSPRLARTLFHTMAKYQQKLEKRQRLMFRFVNIGANLFALSAVCARAAMLLEKDANNRSVLDLVELFAAQIRTDVAREFKAIGKNSDKLSYQIARNVLDKQYGWLEEGILPYF
jgi:alkylation response protein AidB-like acyl-CoA dehydrogenase